MARSPAEYKNARRAVERRKTQFAHAKAARSTGITSGGTWLIGAALLAGIFLAMSSVALLVIGMLPTLVALVTDRSNGRTHTIAIAWANAAGVWPFMMTLWTGSNTYTQALQIVAMPESLAIMYGVAALGWLLYRVLPLAYTEFNQMMLTQRLRALRAEKEKLVEEWGPAVDAPSTAPES